MLIIFGSRTRSLIVGLVLGLLPCGGWVAAGRIPLPDLGGLALAIEEDASPADEPSAPPAAESPDPEQSEQKEQKENEQPESQTEPQQEQPPAEEPAEKQEPSAPEPKAEPSPEEKKPEEKKSEEKKPEEMNPEEMNPEESQEEETPAAETPSEGSEKPSEPAEEGTEEEPEPDDGAELPETIALGEFLVIPKGGSYGRAAIQVDPIEAALARGEWKTPKGGDRFTSSDGRTLRWRTRTMESTGMLSTQSIAGGGYAVTEFESPAAGVMLLRASGHAAVYVNGQLRAGDVYKLGNFDLPVEVRQGKNQLVFHVYQPELHAELVRPAGPVFMIPERVVSPTPVAGTDQHVWIGLPVVNATSEPLAGTRLVAQAEGGEAIETPLPWTGGTTLYHASFEVAIPSSATSPTLPVEVKLMRDDELLAQQQIELTMVGAGELQVRTFRSKIDGSVQSYAIRPASDSAPAGDLVSDQEDGSDAKGVIVALHGLGSSATEFVKHYSAKSWAHVIAPSGRGAYGFDWEDWSRDDAIEALDDANQHFSIDPAQVYLSGHAAGGHGALLLGATQPDRFAAIATSGAWSTLWNYGGGVPQYADPTPPQQMLLRCTNPSATNLLMVNLRGIGVYVQHGSEDKQVPLSEARVLMRALAAVHDDYKFRERVGAESWWDDKTLDDDQTMEFLASRSRTNDSPDLVDLATTDLSAVSKRHWVAIGAQSHPFEPSTLRAERKGDKNPTIEITTTNVDRLYLTKGSVPPRTAFTVRIDGKSPIRLRGLPASGEIWFARQGSRWTRVLSDDKLKGPHRAGGFKEVFSNDPILVYGTKGSAEETAWGRTKARFDAESFYYRGGGSLEVIPDTEFHTERDRDRNVILYGNADTNGAWPALLSLSPVQIRRDHVLVDLRPEADSALGVLMVRPRPGSSTALVGVVGGTTVEGMRLTSRLRYFMAGVHYPDLVILGPNSLSEGDSDLRAAGFFTTEWEVADEDLVWRDLAL